MTTREKAAVNYRKKLLDKFKYNPEVKKIVKKKNVPKYIVNQKNVRQIQKESKFRKQKNLEMNSRAGTVDYTMEKVSKIVKSGVIEK